MTQAWRAQGLEPIALERGDIEGLIPQRPPLLLVERAVAARGGSRPALVASFGITGREPVLAGHLPGRPLWPGAYTIEGLAQACALSGALAARSFDGAADSGPPGAWIPLVVAVKVKLTGVVTPPARLDYFVELTHVVGDVGRFGVEASVDGRQIASGTMDVSLRAGAP